MASELRTLFFTYAPVLVLIPFYLAARAGNKQGELKWVLYYLLLSILTQVVSFGFWYLNLNNLPILHLYTILEFLVIIQIYRSLLQKDHRDPLFLLLSIGFMFFSLIDSLFIEDIYTFNTISRSIEAFVIIVLSLAWFLKSLGSGGEPANRGAYYLVAGFFIYFSGSVVLFSFSNYINHLAYGLLLNIWSLHTLLLVLLYVILSVGIQKLKSA